MDVACTKRLVEHPAARLGALSGILAHAADARYKRDKYIVMDSG